MNTRYRLWVLRVTFLASLAVSSGVTAMLVGHQSASPVVGPYSIAAAAALMLAGAAAGASLILAALSNRRLDRIDAWIRDGLQSLPRDLPGGKRRDGLILAALALASYCLIATRCIRSNEVPRDDQLDYLTVAAEIRRSGVPEFGRQLWSGEYTEANRHPLYTVLLAQLPSFTVAKWFSFLLGLVALALAWWHTVRRSGWLVGGVAAILVATNSLFQQSASIVACEILLVIWTLLAWFQVDHLGFSGRHGLQAFKSSLCVGGLIGLAYLTKASAFFLLVGFVAWSLGVAGFRRWNWLAVVAFGLVASPLLVRNTRAFGDPLHSFNTRFLFADTFAQGLQQPFRGTWTEAIDYWDTHPVHAIAHRAASGLAWEAFIFLRSCGPATLSGTGPLVGLIVLLMALVGASTVPPRIVALVAAWCAIFLLFFAWYVPIASGDRFLAPIVPIVLLFSAKGAMILITSKSAADPDKASRRVLWSALLWCIATTMLAFGS